MYTLEQKIKLIEQSNSFADLNQEVMPKAYKEDYYFVSYSHKDYKKVMKDILLLEDCGINIWYDTDMHVGENWEDIAQTYISKFQCKGIIFYLSKNSILSDACNKEVEYVLENDKQFFSVNIPLEEGEQSSSGLAMLLKLKEQGYNISDRSISNFEKAFSDKMLYLSYGDSIERKREQIQNLKGEDLLVFDYEYNLNTDESSCKLKECRDNSLVKMHFKNNYQVNEEGSKEFGRLYSLQSIDRCVFANSVKLFEVRLPEKMTEIGDYAFINCYKLKNINLDMELCNIRDFAFASCRSLDISTINCKFIGKNAFYRCDSLKNINLNVNEVGFFAFSNCKNLQSVRFLKRPYKLDKFAFSKCKSLKDIYLTNGEANVIKSSSNPIVISESCFEDCTSIEQMTFKGKIDLKNSNGLFCGCHNLTEVVFDVASLKSIPSTAFMHCRKLERVEGLGKVKIFARSSFFMCENLLSADLSGATQFENQAFAYCGLQSLNLPSVVTIQENAFALMDNLTKIVIGSKLKQLESNAFYGLHNVKEIEVHSVGFDFYYDSFAEVHPQTVTVRDVDFLFSLLENNSNELKTVYVEEGLLTEDLLSEAPILLIAQVSDKPGFDKFTVDDSNPYLKYVNKRVIVQFKNDERIYTYCNEAGFDEQRGEYYLVLNKKHYQSEIESVMIDPYY